MSNRKVFFSNRTQQVVLLCSMVFLALPYLIFYIGWLKVQYSIFFCAVLVAMLIFAWKQIKRVNFDTFEISKSHLIVIMLLVLAILVSTGFGAFCGGQAGDWIRNNAILSDLYNKNWPVIYTKEANSQYALNYYIGFYLPAACIGKALHSYRAAEIALLATTYIGFLLGIFWMIKATCANAGKSVALFFVYSGLDCIGFVITAGRIWGMTEHLDHWAIQADGQDFIANYHSIGTAIRWSLNHYIATWIELFIILVFIHKKAYKLCIPMVALTLLWSPLATVGFIPFGIAIFIYEKCNIQKFFSSAGVLSLISIIIPCGLYFMASASSKAGREGVFRNPQWFLDNWVTVALFIMLEFGIWCVLIIQSTCLKSSLDRLLLSTAGIALAAFLTIDYGLCHDFSMRASIVSQYVIFSFLPNAFSFSRGIVKKIFNVVVSLSLLSTSTEYIAALQGLVYHPVTCSRALLEVNTVEGWAFEYQYTGDTSSIFFNVFCKEGISSERAVNGKVCAVALTDSLYTGGIIDKGDYVDILLHSQDIEPMKRMYSLILENGEEILISDVYQAQNVFYRISAGENDAFNWEEFQYPHKFSIRYLAENESVPTNLTDENWTNGLLNSQKVILFDYDQGLYDQLTSAKRLYTSNGASGEIVKVEDMDGIYIHVYFSSMCDGAAFKYPSVISIEK